MVAASAAAAPDGAETEWRGDDCGDPWGCSCCCCMSLMLTEDGRRRTMRGLLKWTRNHCKRVRNNSLRETTVEGNGNECRVYAAWRSAHRRGRERTREYNVRRCSCQINERVCLHGREKRWALTLAQRTQTGTGTDEWRTQGKAATQRRGGARRENKGERKDVTRDGMRVRGKGRKREVEYR